MQPMRSGLGPPAMSIHGLCYGPSGLTYGRRRVRGPHSTFSDARRTSYLDGPNLMCRSCRRLHLLGRQLRYGCLDPFGAPSGFVNGPLAPFGGPHLLPPSGCRTWLVLPRLN